MKIPNRRKGQTQKSASEIFATKEYLYQQVNHSPPNLVICHLISHKNSSQSHAEKQGLGPNVP
ncbi:hypothetical protein BVRB_3g051030 [Beta vulgaris subsp. vulgaris]|uniref:Uncharacterized protein n=1 Tax=Beta vulgaris subsp. vulgaris TaxID=3555 RepID=A0A0J8CRT4_BETVV|nr:hypothetical protein BVRB_3g051030 [Beta vulgaris subsp. vulgaris]